MLSVPKLIRICLSIIILSFTGLYLYEPPVSMEPPLKRSSQGRNEEAPHQDIRSSVNLQYVHMNENSAKALILLHLTHLDINDRDFNSAIQHYLDSLIKGVDTRPFIEAYSDNPFETNIVNAFLNDLMKGKTLTEEGHYILEKAWHEAMIQNAILLFKAHYSTPSPKQKIKNLGVKVSKLTKKTQPVEPITTDPLAPDYQVIKKTMSLHGLLLMKLLRSALKRQIKLEEETLAEAIEQAKIFLHSLGGDENAITPLIQAFRGIPEKKRKSTLSESQQGYLAELGNKGIDWDKKVVMVLSMDGGGTRGLYTARLLQEIELRTGRKIAEVFDVIAGTSTGGILALAVNMPAPEPNPDRKPKYSGKDSVLLYTKLAQTVFPLKHPASKLFWTIYDTQYDADALEGILVDIFGETNLDKTLKNVVIPAFNIKNGQMKVFKTRYAIRDAGMENPRLHDLARFTSAAPTYLGAAERSKSEVYMDGGIGINNPSLLAYHEAIEAYPQAERIILVSLGTTKELKPPKSPKGGILNNLGVVLQGMDVQSQQADTELTKISSKDPHKFTYDRVTETTAEPIDLSKSDPETLNRLLSLAEKTIRSEAWDKMIMKLKDHIRLEDQLSGHENLRRARKNIRGSKGVR